MTAQTSEAALVPAVEQVTLTIDGFEITVPKGTLVIRAAEELGIAIPRFCDHPLLDPVAACRQCLVEVTGQPKPQPSCAITCTDGMVVRTQLTSAVAEKAQRGVMEFLLINHPLDCPMCDKGGECPLQNQAMSNGQGETRFTEEKRHFAKPVPLSTEVLLDRERCISCTRCTRFSEEIAGDQFIDFIERGPDQFIGTADGEPFNSYFSGNTVQICPVGALTGAAYRFRSRPYDLVSDPSVCEHCASGCRQRTDHRRGAVARRLAGNDPEVNEEWNCDKGRWAFTYATEPDRLVTPLVRDETGVLRAASWPEATAAAAAGLARARGRAGVLTGGRLTLEDAYAYAKFARVALGTNDIDCRARPHSVEEAQFLAARVAGQGVDVTYADLEQARTVLLAGFEPEDESPMVFLRLRKATRAERLTVYSLAALDSQGLAKLSGVLLPTPPGGEASALTRLASGTGLDEAQTEAAKALAAGGAIILAGERLAEVPGALSAVAYLAAATGARLAWVPRRAGERGALDAGALPGLLPGGRPVTDAAARAEVARAWGVASLPATPGRGSSQILAAALAGELNALVVGGVDPGDLPSEQDVLAALAATPFVVSLELRASAVTDRADVVFPVAAVVEKAGTFVNWEGRPGSFEAALRVPGKDSDLSVLSLIADDMDVHLGLPDTAAARRELADLAGWRGARDAAPSLTADPAPAPGPGEALLATWYELLDAGRMQDGELFLAGTARPAAAMMSAATAAEVGIQEGGKVTVTTPSGELTVDVCVTDMPDRVVWLPGRARGCETRRVLGAGHGTLVTLRRP
ncbi:MAG TPA: NADH-quinone oxidoreductase subunit G [Streptosporangiaceae bacterium]|nr:NADH-quinone oxidoreductase subunit G [Streptosporangiaceae bacterium]